MQCLLHSIKTVRPIIITDNRLHTLRQPHNDHDEKCKHTIDNSVGSYRHISAIILQCRIDDYHHNTCARIHEKGRHSDTQNRSYNTSMKFETAFLKGNKALFIQEMRQNPNQTCQLRYGRCHSRTTDSPIQDKNEYRRNNHIDCDCKKRRKHRFLRIACRTHQIIQSYKQIRNRIGYQYNLHKIPGIR